MNKFLPDFSTSLHTFSLKPLSTAALLCLVSTSAYSAGIITGTVKDKSDGKVMRGVVVKIPGTYYGALTDANGKYTIKNVAPGKTYTVELSYIGYKKIQKTGTAIADGQTLTIDFTMEQSSVMLDKDVVVIGNKLLVDVEDTQSMRSVGREEIQQMVAENISDILVQQTGVVQQNGEIFIRGGRGYETNYLVDGVAVQDVLSGTGMGMQLNSNAIQNVELITGGANPEFGQMTSGAINIKTREGGEKFEASFGYRKSLRAFTRSAFDRDTNSSFQTDIADVSLGGTLFRDNDLGKLTYFVSLYGMTSDMLVPEFARVQLKSSVLSGNWFAPRMDNAFNGMVNLTWTINPQWRLQLQHTRGISLSQNTRTVLTNLEYTVPAPGYQYAFQNNFDGAATFTSLQSMTKVGVTFTPSARTFIEFRLSNLFSRIKQDANGRDFRDYRQPQDIPQIPGQYYDTTSQRWRIIPGDGFWDTGTTFDWRDQYMNDWIAKGDITHLFTEKSKFKAGIETTFRQMQQAVIYAPWLGPLGLNNDVFKVNTIIGAVYAQHNISFKGLVLNYGLRMDFWAPGDLVDAAVANPNIRTITEEQRDNYNNSTVNLLGYRWKTRLAPRLGVSHPITNTQTLFFNYGHFNKLPRPQFVYQKLSPQQANSTYQNFGNPALNPETSINYEIGLKSQLSNDDVLTITGYYRNIFDYVVTRQAVAPGQSLRDASFSFTTYVNADYARARGVEIEYKKRISNWFTGLASVSYSLVTGRSSTADQGSLVQRGLAEERIQEDFMPWDRPWTVNITANFFIPKNEPLFDISWLSEINAYARFFFQNGLRYTPYEPLIDPATGQQAVLPNGKLNWKLVENRPLSELARSWWWVDVNLDKTIRFDDFSFQVSLEVLNVFDVKNSEVNNPLTGRAYEYGDQTLPSVNDPKYPDLQAPISPYPFNPARYMNRRTFRFGLSFKL